MKITDYPIAWPAPANLNTVNFYLQASPNKASILPIRTNHTIAIYTDTGSCDNCERRSGELVSANAISDSINPIFYLNHNSFFQFLSLAFLHTNEGVFLIITCFEIGFFGAVSQVLESDLSKCSRLTLVNTSIKQQT